MAVSGPGRQQRVHLATSAVRPSGRCDHPGLLNLWLLNTIYIGGGALPELVYCSGRNGVLQCYTVLNLVVHKLAALTVKSAFAANAEWSALLQEGAQGDHHLHSIDDLRLRFV